MGFVDDYFLELKQIFTSINTDDIEKMALLISEIRQSKGRLFILGVGGGAGNASHAVNDFRKICGVEAYAPTDNVSELSARTNDEGWETVFIEWLKISKLCSEDGILIFSVGGGNKEKNVSTNIVHAIDYAKHIGSKIMGIVGKDGGMTAKMANACCIVPTVNPINVTPQTEGLQAVVWHALVSHPKLKQKETKWESIGRI